MRRRTFFLGLGGLAGCGGTRRPRLNVMNWSDYVAPDTISGFERETGIEVRYTTYESVEEMLAKVMSGNSGWDVVFPSNSFLDPMRQMGLLAKLDRSRIPHLKDLTGLLARPPWDPGLEWCAPYMWGAAGILYQRDAAPPPVAWADLWQDRFRGRFTMLDDPAETIGAALKKLGLPLNTESAQDLARARGELIRQKPLVRAYLNGEAKNQMVSGDLAAAHLWTGTAPMAMAAAPHLAWVYPKEGYSRYADVAVVLRESRRPELAHRFIDYLLRPEVSAAVARHVRTAPASPAARALLEPALREDPTLFPPPEVEARGEWLAPVSPAAQRLRDRIWTEVRAA